MAARNSFIQLAAPCATDGIDDRTDQQRAANVDAHRPTAARTDAGVPVGVGRGRGGGSVVTFVLCRVLRVVSTPNAHKVDRTVYLKYILPAVCAL